MMNRVVVTYDKGTIHHRAIPSIENREMMEYYSTQDDIVVSDGYHTFDELYRHRYTLLCALVKVYDNYKTPLGTVVTCYKSKLHHDGTMYPGQFIVMITYRHGMESKPPKQISYHLPLEWWDKFNIMEVEKMWEWDGHNSTDVLERLLEL